MSESVSRETRLRSQMDAVWMAATRHGDRALRLNKEKSVAPVAGEVYLSRRTADFPVEWLVIEQRDSRCQVVVVDEHPFVGSEDVSLPTEALGGPHISRCGLSAWCDADCFEPNLRTGVLPEITLHQVRTRVQAIADVSLSPRLSERDIDEDPEYQLWRNRTLLRSVQALGTQPKGIGQQANDNVPWAWRKQLTALVVLMLLPAAWFVWQMNEDLGEARARVALLEDLTVQQASEIVEAERSELAKAELIRQLEERIQELSRALETARPDRAEALQTQIAELRAQIGRAVQTAVIGNLPVFRLDHRSLRGGSGVRSFTDFQLNGKAMVLWEVDVAEVEPYRIYEVCFGKSGGDDRCLLEFDDLVLQEGRFLRIGMPTDLLEEGNYEVTLTGKRRGESTRLDETYDVRIEP